MTRSFNLPTWNRTKPTNHVVVEPKPVSVEAIDLQVGDVIELPVIQRLVVTNITTASEGAVVVGMNMLVVNSDGYGGVFDKLEAAPILLPANARVNLVSHYVSEKIASVGHTGPVGNVGPVGIQGKPSV